jgi:hypothetical protein
MSARGVYDATLEYIRRVLLGLDEFGNTLAGGQPGESVSYRAAVARNNGEKWGCVFCQFLNLFQTDHCDKAVAAFDAQVEQAAQEIVQETAALTAKDGV